MFYPTTDEYLRTIKDRYPDHPDIHYLSDFVIRNRKAMKLTEELKKKIDRWFDDRSADELVYIFEKYGLVKESDSLPCVSDMFTPEQMREAYMDGFIHGYHDDENFDINNYR